MRNLREDYLKEKLENEKKQLEEVINNPNLTAEELWLLTEDNFIKWRKKHDYPKLIKSFNNSLPSFIQWKNEYEITDEIIIECGITECVRPKRLSKNDKFFYLLEQTFDEKKRLLVSYADLEKVAKPNPEHNESFKLIIKFLSYSDWCESKKIKSDVFNIGTRQAPESDIEKVWLTSGYELLKMGGIKPPVNVFGILLRGKHLEFVNLCGLKLEGTIHFGEEGNLSLSYCAVDNLICINLDMSLMKFESCSMENIKIIDSNIRQWRFWDSDVTGEIINSKLNVVNVFGGLFNPLFKDTNILDVNAEHKGFSERNFSYTYSILKKMYSDQGDETKSTEYLIKEREIYREYSKGWEYLIKTISYYYWGYGKKPERVIYFSILLILLCSIIYLVPPNNMITPIDKEKTFLDCFYFSTVTYTTLGYGDMSPIGWVRIISSIEAFFGALSLGFIVAGFSNTKY